MTGDAPPGAWSERPPEPISVVLQPAAADSIRVHAAASADGLETGGLLLGHLYSDRVVVSYAGGPGPLAVRKRTRFVRDLDHAQGLADAAWKLDRSVWLGEWHTHPNGVTVPSGADLATYTKHLDDPDLTLCIFLSLIVVEAPDWNRPGIVAWIVTGPLGTATAAVSTLVLATNADRENQRMRNTR